VDSEGRIFVGTAGHYNDGGIFRSINSSSIGQYNSFNMLENSTLLSNYPNPFNPNTKIYYEFPNTIFKSGFISIYNYKGEEI
jgi:hypothetical protein